MCVRGHDVRPGSTLSHPVPRHTKFSSPNASSGRMPYAHQHALFFGGIPNEVKPKYERHYHEATVIAGDWFYIKSHMPPDMEGKVIVTNTTTSTDIEFMKARGIRYLVTTTPVLEGRSFGTNAIEAALIAAAGKQRPLHDEEIARVIAEVGLKPSIQELF